MSKVYPEIVWHISSHYFLLMIIVYSEEAMELTIWFFLSPAHIHNDTVA